MRGQAYTLESVAASLLVLFGILFALQVTVVTPLASSTANEHLGNQLDAAADGVLGTAVENGALRPTLLGWNEDEGRFHSVSGRGYHVAGGPPTELGEMLNETFEDRRVAYNVYLDYPTGDGGHERAVLVRSGTPADDAVSASRLVTLYDEDNLRTASGGTGSTLASAETYFAPNAIDGPVYSVVEVEVVAWET